MRADISTRGGAPPGTLKHGTRPKLGGRAGSETANIDKLNGRQHTPQHSTAQLRRARGLEPIGIIVARMRAKAIRQRTVEQVHALGARTMHEFLIELSREHGIGAEIDVKLARYAKLTAKQLRVAGGDRFEPVPLHEVLR